VGADVVERALVALAFLGLVTLVALGVRRLARRERARVLAGPADAALATGVPTILYFHGDRCSDCVVQERELDALLTAHPEVAIRADHAPSRLSARYRVLTVPTTVVLDGGGKAHAVNYGLTRRDVLEAQLAALGRLEASA
jgi:hypothetical protein